MTQRGQGRVFLRGQLLWIAYFLRGREFRESAKTSDPKQAAKFLRYRLKEVGADQLNIRTFTTPQANKLTVGELVAALRADFELRGKLSSQNRSHLSRVDRDFGECRAVGLTAEKIDAYVEKRIANGDAPATVNRATQLVGQAFALAVRRGHLSRGPQIRHLSEAGNARQGFFNEQEFRAVVEHLPRDLRDFARFAFFTGMRKSEAAGLTWDMVQGNELHIPANICKNRQARVLPLAGELAQIIQRRREAARIEVNGAVQMVPFIFHRHGSRVGDFKKSWATATRLAGVPGKMFHDLRRSAVRRMVRAGINPQIAKKWSGHVSDSMFQRYSILTTDDLREAFEATEKFLEAEAAKQPQVVSMRG